MHNMIHKNTYFNIYIKFKNEFPQMINIISFLDYSGSRSLSPYIFIVK